MPTRHVSPPTTGLFGSYSVVRKSAKIPITIDPEFQSLIPPLTTDERRQLEANIRDGGCRDALVVWDGILLDGHNRHEICTRLNVKYRVTAIDLPNRDAAKTWIIRNQFGRRNLNTFVRCELALKLEPLIAAKAKQNQRRHGNTSPGKKSLPQNSSEVSIDTRGVVAADADASHDTIRKVKVIVASASADVLERLRDGKTTIHKEYQAIVKAERHADQVKAVQAAEVPAGKFSVIVVDPPWLYSGPRRTDSTHRAASPYPSMTVEQIGGMDVAAMAMPDCVLWLWTTNAFMVEAHAVAAGWGFTVKTILTWAKDQAGLGSWLRGQTEHCLMCVRGNPVVTLGYQSTLLTANRRQHSRKPDEFYALVESLCHGTKCELFSRERRKGWTCGGSETNKFK